MRNDLEAALLTPVAWVAEVAVDSAGGDLGDKGKAPLVLGGLDLGENGSDESLIESGRDKIGDIVPAVHHQVEDPIDLLVGEAKLRAAQKKIRCVAGMQEVFPG